MESSAPKKTSACGQFSRHWPQKSHPPDEKSSAGMPDCIEMIDCGQ
jgi:hypothetical protein